LFTFQHIVKEAMLNILKYIFLFFFMFFFFNQSYAHGDISKRIKEISLSINQYPDSISLYHKRGVLYTQHGDFDLALNDFDFCRSINYNNIYLNLDVAAVYLYLKNFKKAAAEVDKVLCEKPLNMMALQLKGEILKQQDDYIKAAEYFDDALYVNTNPKPEDYIQLYNTWLLSAHSEANCKALEVIEKGMNKLGPLYVFQKQLIDYHLNNGDVNDAINIQTEVINTLNRREHAYYDLAIMKIDAGMKESAINDLMLAENAIDKLPSKIKTLKATTQLSKNIYQLKSTFLLPTY